MDYSDMTISFVLGAAASYLIGRGLEMVTKLKKTVDYIDQYVGYLGSVHEVLESFQEERGTELEFNRLKHLLFNVNTLEWSQRFIDARITDTTSSGVSVIVGLQNRLHGLTSYEAAGYSKVEIVVIRSKLLQAKLKLISLRDKRKKELGPLGA